LFLGNVFHPDIQPNGKPAAMKYYGVFIFNDEGKITTGLEWYNTADLVPADEEGEE